ncbi:hypothetical protein BC828DRAFT_408927 [Blastocladiella britannica]|nr:hypothetical protein BC828DRAFT_408927 [Blastocladiella britannica]
MVSKAVAAAKKKAAKAKAATRQAAAAAPAKVAPTLTTKDDSSSSAAEPKKCIHSRIAVKAKKFESASIPAFVQPISCLARPCTDKSSDAAAPHTHWICLYCQAVVCTHDRAAHEHAILMAFPHEAGEPWTADDMKQAHEDGTLVVHCKLCQRDVPFDDDPHIKAATAAIFLRLEEIEKRQDAVASLEAQRQAQELAIARQRDYELYQGLQAELRKMEMQRRQQLATMLEQMSIDEATTASLMSYTQFKGPSDALLMANEFLPLGVRAMRNLGNTCYANALIQVLAHTRHLPVPAADVLPTLDPVAEGLFDMLHIMADPDSPITNPLLHAANVLQPLSRRFDEFDNPNTPNDSHEMLVCLADELDTQHLKREKERLSAAAAAAEGDDQEGAQEQAVAELSPVNKCFRSILNSHIDCKSCGRRQTVTEEFYDLSVMVSDTLERSIAQFFADESDTVQKTCENPDCPSLSSTNSANGEEEDASTTGGPTEHAKHYMVKELAPTLCLQLKHTSEAKELNPTFPAYLTVPKQFIDPDCRETAVLGGGPATYELYGVIQHLGNMHYGHYMASIKVHRPLLDNSLRGTPAAVPKRADNDVDESADSGFDWLFVDDASVYRSTEDQVLKSEAPYMLFYQRCSSSE